MACARPCTKRAKNRAFRRSATKRAEAVDVLGEVIRLASRIAAEKSEGKGKGTMGKIIGIDLGTTNSVVAIMEGREPKVIVNEEGSRLTPSVVAYTKEGERLVGQVAKRQAITNPEQTVYSIKRVMGRRVSEVQDEMKRVPYHVVEGPSGDARIEIDGKQNSPPEISAQILLKLKRAAENY